MNSWFSLLNGVTVPTYIIYYDILSQYDIMISKK